MDLVQAQRFKPKLPSSISYLRMVSSWQLTDHWGTKRCLGGGRLVDMQPSHYRWTSACMNERVYRICTVSHYKERGADIEVAGSGQGGGGRNWLKFIFCLILYVNNVHKHTHERPSMRTMSRQLLKGGGGRDLCTLRLLCSGRWARINHQRLGACTCVCMEQLHVILSMWQEVGGWLWWTFLVQSWP